MSLGLTIPGFGTAPHELRGAEVAHATVLTIRTRLLEVRAALKMKQMASISIVLSDSEGSESGPKIGDH